MNIEDKIKRILSNIIQIPVDQIDVNASFFEEYGMDSLRALEILAEVENTYQIIIDPEKLMQMTSIAEVVKITQEYLYKQNG